LATGDGALQWLRRGWRLATRLARRPVPGSGGDRQPAVVASNRAREANVEWVLLESVHAAALGSLYQQVLANAGIPVRLREWGGGSALLGGVPVGVSLFVPSNRLDEARAILQLDAAREGSEHEG